jgi:hypothetical protein
MLQTIFGILMKQTSKQENNHEQGFCKMKFRPCVQHSPKIQGVDDC